MTRVDQSVCAVDNACNDRHDTSLGHVNNMETREKRKQGFHLYRVYLTSFVPVLVQFFLLLFLRHSHSRKHFYFYSTAFSPAFAHALHQQSKAMATTGHVSVDAMARHSETYSDAPTPYPALTTNTTIPAASGFDMGRQFQEQAQVVDTTAAYVAGFVIGWFTWLFGSVLGLFAGRGKHATALRKGLIVGAIAVSLPFAALVVLGWYFMHKIDKFFDKFSIF